MKKLCSRESSEVLSLLNGISILVIQKLNIIKSPEPSENMILINSWMSCGPLGRTRLLAVFVNVPLESAVS